MRIVMVCHALRSDDDARDAALRAFLVEPVRRLGITAATHGALHPDAARAALAGLSAAPARRGALAEATGGLA